MSRMLVLVVLLGGCAAHVPSPRAPAATPATPVRPELTRAELRDQLAARRELQIARLRAYAAAGAFAAPDQLVDAAGRLDPIAALMDASGEGALVRLTAAHSNGLFFPDVKDGPLLDWILASGLTQAEAGYLQLPHQKIDAERLARAEARLVADTDESLDAAVACLAARSHARD